LANGIVAHNCRCALIPDWLNSPGTPNGPDVIGDAGEGEEPAESAEDEAGGSEAEAEAEGEPGGEDEAAAEPEPETAPDPVAEAQALADAYNAGHEDGERLMGGQGGSPVRRVTLSDGTEAVVKSAQEPEEALNGYLAGLTARALGLDGTATALIGDGTTVSPLLPGVTGAALREAAGESELAGGSQAELERIMNLDGGKEIGLLDFLTANADRNDGNYLVDGGTVKPIDHAFANFAELMTEDTGPEILSPFARYWVTDGQDITARDSVPLGSLRSPYIADELAGIRQSLSSLEGEFTAKGAAASYGFMMDRLAILEATL